MKVLTMPQGSLEWWTARRGLPTASEFFRFTNGAGKLSTARARNDNGLSDGAKSYLAEKLAETHGWVKDEFRGSPDIERGHELESRARNYLAFELGEEVEEVGTCLSDCGRYAASPDGIIGGLEKPVPIELKCPDLHTHYRYLIDGGGLPDKYKAQVHGQMIVTGADYAYFCAYVSQPDVPNILERVERDSYTEQLKASVEEFCERLEEAKNKYSENQPTN